jgi:hypothetical protein
VLAIPIYLLGYVSHPSLEFLLLRTCFRALLE